MTSEPNSDLLSVLTREGVLISASIRYPRFHKKLNPADLGLEPEQVSDRLVSLGHKRLLPKDALAELALVESRTHAIVEKSTFSFLGGIGRFLPNAKLVEVREQMDALNLADDTEMETLLERVRADLLSRSAEDYRQSLSASRGLEAGLSQLRDHARELASQDTRELVERFGQMGRRKLQLAG